LAGNGSPPDKGTYSASIGPFSGIFNALSGKGQAIAKQFAERMTNAEERRVEELHVDQPHQRKASLRLVLQRVVKRRPWDRQQRTLLADRQFREL
jgi:hypothetical protein